MPRKPRHYPPRIPAHVVQRGNNHEDGFSANADYRVYLEGLDFACAEFACASYACAASGCAMSTAIQTVRMHFMGGYPQAPTTEFRG